MNIAIGVFKALALIACPLLAAAADHMMRRVDPTMLPLLTWLWVVGLSVIGYLASSAELLLGWLDTGGWAVLGRAVQRFFASLAAGVSSFLLGLYAEFPMILCFLGVMPSAYAGEHYLRKLYERRTGIVRTHEKK